MKLMKRVARRVTLNLSESKRFSSINVNAFAPTAGTAQFYWSYINIFAQLPTATGAIAGSSFAIDGNEIVDLLMKVKATFIIPAYADLGGTNTGYGTRFLTIYLVAANDYTGPVIGGGPPPGTITWTNYPGQYTSTDPGWFLQPDGSKPTLNGNNVKVLRKWTKRYQPDEIVKVVPVGGATTTNFGHVYLPITLKHKFRGKHTFEDNPFGDLDSNYPRAGVLRGWNYYLLAGWGATAQIPGPQQPQLFVDQFLYFKDP